MYVDEAYYKDTFHGEPVDPADFPALCERAGELIEELTLYRLTPVTFLAMPENVQNLMTLLENCNQEILGLGTAEPAVVLDATPVTPPPSK